MSYKPFKAEIYHGNSDNRQCEQCRQAPLTIHNIFQTCWGFFERAKNKCRSAATHTHTYYCCSKKNRWSCQQCKHKWLLKTANKCPAKQPFLAIQAAYSELSLSSPSLQAIIIWDPDSLSWRGLRTSKPLDLLYPAYSHNSTLLTSHGLLPFWK